MPRTGRGGRRGRERPGTIPHPQRTDLQASVPIEVQPHQEYGQAAQQTASQQALPVAPPPGPAGAGPPPSAPSSPAPAPGGPPQAPLPGGGLVPFLHPTNRPNEPVTAGLPSGPGPGPEALTGLAAVGANGATEQGTVKNLLSSLAAQPFSSSAIRDLASVAGAGQ